MNDESSKDQSPPNSTRASTATKDSKEDEAKIIEWVNQIKEESNRESALTELSRKRESFADLALYIWYSSGTVSVLLQEIIYTYQLLAPPKLTIQTSNRACNVLALFQCVAAHPETRPAFLAAQIPIFLYPFLNTVNKTKPFEYLRLTALGVIGALVKVDNSEVITFLLNTEIIPLCLRIMERGSELSKTVATFIVQRILLDENGLNYICNTAERFFAISTVLNQMIKNSPTNRLIKHIIRSYARLADNHIARNILKENIPNEMKEKSFFNSLDESSKKWMLNLLKALSEKSPNTVTPEVTNPMPRMNANMMNNLVMNNMNQIPMNQMNQQGFMMQPSSNDFTNYGMYNDNYMMDNSAKNMYMPQAGSNGKGFGVGMNQYPFFGKK